MDLKKILVIIAICAIICVVLGLFLINSNDNSISDDSVESDSNTNNITNISQDNKNNTPTPKEDESNSSSEHKFYEDKIIKEEWNEHENLDIFYQIDTYGNVKVTYYDKEGNIMSPEDAKAYMNHTENNVGYYE